MTIFPIFLPMAIKILFLFLLIGLTNCLAPERDCHCRTESHSKIIGGRVAHHLDWPWAGTISKGLYLGGPSQRNWVDTNFKIHDVHFCGAVLINERWAVTAAHCVGKQWDSYAIGFGNQHDLVRTFDAGRIKVKRTIKHPDYIPKTFDNDIALMELARPVNFTSSVQPACLIPNYVGEKDKKLMGIGYGFDQHFRINMQTGERSTNGTKSRYLKEVDLKDSSYSDPECANPTKVCVIGRTKEDGRLEGPCFGDSGSSLHYVENGRTYTVGIVSSSPRGYEGNTMISCTGLAHYTRLSSFHNFIRKYAGSFCVGVGSGG